MNKFLKVLLAATLLTVGATATAQDTEDEQLKRAALEALMSAPPERALPIVQRLLARDSSRELKQRALFVLGQIDHPDATALLVETARNEEPELQAAAVRAIGINGNPDAVAALEGIYAGGSPQAKYAVLEAYLIADYPEGLYRIAADTDDPAEFERAVHKLGAMGATEALRALRGRVEMSDKLIDAFAVAGDVESLSALARDDSNPERQARAIRGLAIADEDGTEAMLEEIYRGSSDAQVREATRRAFLIAGHDETVLRLYRDSTDAAEKRELLQLLVMMDSDAAWNLVEQALEEDE